MSEVYGCSVRSVRSKESCFSSLLSGNVLALVVMISASLGKILPGCEKQRLGA